MGNYSVTVSEFGYFLFAIIYFFVNFQIFHLCIFNQCKKIHLVCNTRSIIKKRNELVLRIRQKGCLGNCVKIQNYSWSDYWWTHFAQESLRILIYSLDIPIPREIFFVQHWWHENLFIIISSIRDNVIHKFSFLCVICWF